MDDLIEQFLEYKQRNEGRSEATAVKYRHYLQLLTAYFMDIEGDPIGATQEELEAFTGLYLHRKGLAPRSRRTVVSCVRGFYAWLTRTGVIKSSPAADVPSPSAGRRLPRTMTIAQAEQLLMAPGVETFIGVRNTAMISLLIGCGIRLSGLVGLNESSLIWTLNKGREELMIRVMEKGGRERIVPAPAECWALMRAYIGHPELAEIDRALEDGDQVLFVSTNNRSITEDKYRGEERRISRRSVQDMIERYGNQVGLPRDILHAHAFRHLYGTELAEDDIDILQRQALMGHADPKSTEIYTHLAMRKLRQSVDKANPLRKMRTPFSELARELSGD